MRKFVVVFATVALLLQAGTALAGNQWGSNHWASDNLDMTVSDSGFDAGATRDMLDEWRVGSLDPQFKTRGKGQIVVTTGRSMLWLGRAQIWVDGSGHVTKGQVKMNTTLLASLYPGSGHETKQVLCQELGHIFGLAHTTEPSCMNDTGDLGASPSPAIHDRALLNTIYAHPDGGSGGGGGGGGDCPNPKSKSPKCDAQSSGRWVTVDTFWAPTDP